MTKEEAIEYFGGLPKLAALLQLTRQAIHAWKDHEEVADLYQYKLHYLSEGKLPLKAKPTPGLVTEVRAPQQQ